MRKLTSLAIILLASVLIVSALGDLDITTQDQEFTKNAGTSFTFDVLIKNTGNETLSDVTLSEQGDNFGDINLTFKDAFNIAAGQTATTTVTAEIPSSTSAATYVGTLMAETADLEHSDTMSLTITVEETGSLTTEDTPVTLTGNPEGSTETKTFTIKNNGNMFLDNIAVNFVQEAFTDDGGNDITLNFSETKDISLAPGEELDVTVSGAIEEGMYIDLYSGSISLKDETTTYHQFDLDVEVKSDIVEMSIKDIDPNPVDPGDDLTIEVKFDNKAGEDIDDLETTVKILDIDSGEDLELEIDKFDLDKGEDNPEDFDFEIPLNVDEGEFDILVIADGELKDSDESFRVVQLFKNEVEVEKEQDDRVEFDDFSIDPETVSCGNTIFVEATVFNTGSSDQDDMYVELTINELSITRTTSEFDLDSQDEDERENDVDFTITIPDDAEEGVTELKLWAKDEDGDTLGTKTGSFTISGSCTESADPDSDPGDSEDVTVTIEDSTLEAEPGDSLTIPVEITNDGTETETFTIEVSDYSSFATLSGIDQPREDLEEGETSTGFVTLILDEDADEDSYSITITVENSAGDQVSEKTVVVSVEESGSIKGVPPTGFTSFFDNLGGSSWTSVLIILGDLVLLLVIVFFLKLIFKKN